MFARKSTLQREPRVTPIDLTKVEEEARKKERERAKAEEEELLSVSRVRALSEPSPPTLDSIKNAGGDSSADWREMMRDTWKQEISSNMKEEKANWFSQQLSSKCPLSSNSFKASSLSQIPLKKVIADVLLSLKQTWSDQVTTDSASFGQKISLMSYPIESREAQELSSHFSSTPHPALRSFKLNTHYMGDVGGCAIANAFAKDKVVVSLLLNDSPVKECRVKSNPLGNASAVAFAQCLRENKTLRTFGLTHQTGIDDVGLSALSCALFENETITCLEISSTTLTSEGGRELSELLCVSQSITSASFRKCKASSETLLQIVESALYNPHLQKLEFSGITSKVIQLSTKQQARIIEVTSNSGLLYLGLHELLTLDNSVLLQVWSLFHVILFFYVTNLMTVYD